MSEAAKDMANPRAGAIRVALFTGLYVLVSVVAMLLLPLEGAMRLFAALAVGLAAGGAAIWVFRKRLPKLDLRTRFSPFGHGLGLAAVFGVLLWGVPMAVIMGLYRFLDGASANPGVLAGTTGVWLIAGALFGVAMSLFTPREGCANRESHENRSGQAG